MPGIDVETVRQTIVDNFAVHADDIRVGDDGASLTFYLPADALDDAQAALDYEVEVSRILRS